MDLVYQADDEGWNVVFAERDKALYVDRLYDALGSRTWGEFRASLPEGGWEEFLERFGGEYDADGNLVDDFPTGSEPFEGDYQRTGYPEWLANTELKWFPKDLIEKYGGRVEHS